MSDTRRRPALKVTVEDRAGQRVAEVPLGDATVTLGRGAANRIVLASPYISTFHLAIEATATGHVVRQAGMNATYVNRRPLARGEALPLSRGDTIEMPGFRLKVGALERRDEEAAPINLMRLYSALKTSLHEALLKRVDLRKLMAEQLPMEERQERIRATLDEILDADLGLSPELEDFVVAECVRRSLADRLIVSAAGAEKEARKLGEPSWAADARELSMNAFVDACGRDLALDDAAVAVRKRLQAIADGFPQVYRRRRASLAAAVRQRFVVRAIRRDLEDLVFGLGPLEDLLQVPDLTEIMVVGRNRIFVERRGVMEETGRTFPSDEDLEVVIGRVVDTAGRFVNRSQPTCDARLPDGSRVNVVIPPVAIRGPAITIRRFRPEPFSVEELVDLGTVTPQALAFLCACIAVRKNIIISGGTGSGKTTLLNTLSSQIAAQERIVVIEDAAELQLPHANLVVLEARLPNIEGEGEITIRDLVRNALRMRPDRIVVGECRGKEALDMLQAMNTGHDGCLTTAHANSPRDLIGRLEVMVMQAGMDLPVRAIHRQIVGAIQVIVQVARLPEGRRVTHITEVRGLDDDTGDLVLEDVFRLSSERGPTGRADLCLSGYLPSFIDEITAGGRVSLAQLY